MESPDRRPYDDVAFATVMAMVLMENYAGTGHLGGPLACIPFATACHLGGPENGGLRYDLRTPKHPFADRFMVCGGHGIPAAYALWMVLYEALRVEREATGREDFAFDPAVAILPVDALGFRRGAGALRTLLEDHGLAGHPLFADARLRGIRALSGHSESTDVTNDVNGGPSGVGVSTAAGKAMAFDMAGAPPEMKVLAIEGEFAMTEGHAQELKTTAVAQAVGKRLRILLSENNAGIDDALVGGVVPAEFTGYRIAEQWSSYGWNVFETGDGCDVAEVLRAMREMEAWPADDRRPMILVGRTTKGWWPGAEGGMLPGGVRLLTGAPSHPFPQEMSGPYVRALAATFTGRYGIRFPGLEAGRPRTEADRLVACLTDVRAALSVLRTVPGLSAWIAGRLVGIAGSFPRRPRLRFDPAVSSFPPDRLRPESLPARPVEVPAAGAPKTVTLFRRAGERAGARRAVSEVLKWAQHVSGNRFLTIAADLSSSVNVEDGHLTGHYHPVRNPGGTRLPAAIQEAGNTGLVLGALSVSFSEDPETFAGYWGLTATYGAFTPLMYTHVRVFSQQVQDSPFRLGVLTVLAAHSGPETAADARTHFGIFAPRVFDLLPRGQVLNLHCADYNDVAPAWFAAARLAATRRDIGVIVLHVARPDAEVFDRMAFADPDLLAAARGIYLVRDYLPGLPPAGTVLLQGASATAAAVSLLPVLAERGLNVRLAAVVSEDLFRLEDEGYRRAVLPEAALLDAMVVSTGTKRAPPVSGLPPVAEEYSRYADFDDRWRTGGSEADVIAEARLDPSAILEAVERFVRERPSRLARQRAALDALRDGPGAVG